MALQEKHRSSIYRSLVPILGEEETQAMLSHFPATEGDQLVTREHLRAELALTRGELRSEMGELRSEMGDLRTDLRAEMGELRTDLRAEMGDLRTDMAGLRTDMAGLRTEMHLLANRTIVWLGTSILAAAGLVIAFG